MSILRDMQAKSVAAEAKVDDLYHACFTSDVGQKVLAHMAGQVGLVMPDSASDAALRYREGQRALVAGIMHRIESASARSRE